MKYYTTAFDGKMDNIKVWNRVLTKYKIYLLWWYGDIPDYLDVYKLREIREKLEVEQRWYEWNNFPVIKNLKRLWREG